MFVRYSYTSLFLYASAETITVNYLTLEITVALPINTWNPLHATMLCNKFGWNWPSGSGDVFFSFIYSCYFVSIFLWKRMWTSFEKNLNTLDPRMLFAKFGWNSPGGSWENKNMKSLQTDGRRTTGDRKNSFKFSLSELIIYFLLFDLYDHACSKIKHFRNLYQTSTKLKAQLSFTDSLLSVVCLSVCPSVRKLFTF